MDFCLELVLNLCMDRDKFGKLTRGELTRLYFRLHTSIVNKIRKYVASNEGQMPHMVDCLMPHHLKLT